MNVAVVAPAPTVTFAGTVAREVLLLERVTKTPAAGAAPVSVTVPLEGLPPVTEVGFRLMELRRGAVTVRVAFLVTALYVAEMVTAVLVATGFVVTVNFAVVAFAATVTLAGTTATPVLLLVRTTTVPPAGALRLSVTVPVDEFPPVTELGVRVTELMATVFTVKVAFLVRVL